MAIETVAMTAAQLAAYLAQAPEYATLAQAIAQGGFYILENGIPASTALVASGGAAVATYGTGTALELAATSQLAATGVQVSTSAVTLMETGTGLATVGLGAVELGTAVAAAAPLLGVGIGAGLYESNPALWTKISQKLLPFCYPGTTKVPTFLDIVQETGAYKMLVSLGLVEALEEVFEAEGIGTPADYTEYVDATLGSVSTFTEYIVLNNGTPYQSYIADEGTFFWRQSVQTINAAKVNSTGGGYTETTISTGTSTHYNLGSSTTSPNGNTIRARQSSSLSPPGGAYTSEAPISSLANPLPSGYTANKAVADIIAGGQIVPQPGGYPAGTSPWSSVDAPEVLPYVQPIIIVPDPVGPNYEPLPVTPMVPSTPMLPPHTNPIPLPEHVPTPVEPIQPTEPEYPPDNWPEEDPWPTVIPFPWTDPTPDPTAPWPEHIPWPLPEVPPYEWPTAPQWPTEVPIPQPWPVTPEQWPEESPWPENPPEWWPLNPWPQSPEKWPSEIPWPETPPESWPEEVPWPTSPDNWPEELPWPETKPDDWPETIPWPESPSEWPEEVPWPVPWPEEWPLEDPWPPVWPSELPYPYQFPEPAPSPDPEDDPDPTTVDDPETQVKPTILPSPYPWPEGDPEPDPYDPNPEPPDPSVDPSQPQPMPEPEPSPYDPEPPAPGGLSPDPTPPIIPLPFSATTGLITVYNPTQTELLNFAHWLWVTWQDATIEKIWNNPFDGVITLFELYCTPTVEGRKNIRSGFLDSGVESNYISRYTEIDCGCIGVPEYYGNYLDYSPYSKAHIYLPFIGVVELNVDDIVGHAVNVLYRIDEYNGSCIAMITVAKVTEVNGVEVDYSNTFYQFSGNCAVELPIAGGSQAAIKAGMLQAAAYGLGSVIGGVITGASNGGLAGAISGGASGLAYGAAQAVSSVVSAKSSVQHSGSFGASYGAMGIKTPFITITRPKQIQVPNYEAMYGFPAHKAVIIGQCTGFLRCREVHIHSATASDEENALIEQMLKEGVIIGGSV